MKKIVVGIVIILIIGVGYFLSKDSIQKEDVVVQKNDTQQFNKKYIDFSYQDPSTKKESGVTISVDESLLGSKTISKTTPPQPGVQQDVYIGGDMEQATYDSEKHTWSGFYTTYKTKNGLVVHSIQDGEGGYYGESFLIEVLNKNIWLSIAGGYDGIAVYDLGRTDDPEYKEYLQIRPLIESIQVVN